MKIVMDINITELNKFLIKKFSELEEKYHDEVDWQEGNETKRTKKYFFE